MPQEGERRISRERGARGADDEWEAPAEWADAPAMDDEVLQAGAREPVHVRERAFDARELIERKRARMRAGDPGRGGTPGAGCADADAAGERPRQRTGFSQPYNARSARSAAPVAGQVGARPVR